MNPVASDESLHQAAFLTTDWTLVMSAQSVSPAVTQALENICRDYWRPLYAFVRREGYTREEAQDLTQGFFERFLERRDLDAVRREKGRLRSYFLAALKNFLSNERGRAMTIKRGEGRRLIPLDELTREADADLAGVNHLSTGSDLRPALGADGPRTGIRETEGGIRRDRKDGAVRATQKFPGK